MMSTGLARALGDIARAKGMTQVAKNTGLSGKSLYGRSSAMQSSFATVLKVTRLWAALHAPCRLLVRVIQIHCIKHRRASKTLRPASGGRLIEAGGRKLDRLAHQHHSPTRHHLATQNC